MDLRPLKPRDLARFVYVCLRNCRPSVWRAKQWAQHAVFAHRGRERAAKILDGVGRHWASRDNQSRCVPAAATTGWQQSAMRYPMCLCACMCHHESASSSASGALTQRGLAQLAPALFETEAHRRTCKRILAASRRVCPMRASLCT